MSYILEALKKAEADRRAGTLQRTSLPTGIPSTEPLPSSPGRWRWRLTAAVALALAGTLWVTLEAIGPQTPTQTASHNAPAARLPALPAAAALPAIPAHELPATPSAPAPVSAAGAPDLTPQSPPAAERPVPEKTVPDRQEKRKPAKKPAPADTEAATARLSQPPRAEPITATLADLPPQVRSELPALEVGGYIYSGNRADRSVLINKRLLREGDEIASGLTLEQMAPNGMILNYKGYRYRAPY